MHFGSVSERVAIVGNGPVSSHHGCEIDSCDRVVRFNIPRLLNRGAGTAFDDWYIANKRAFFYLEAPFRNQAYRLLPTRIFWARRDGFDKEIIQQNHLPFEKIKGTVSEECLLLAESFYQGSDLIPSAGFLALLYESLAGNQVHLFGFTFEGWCGHNWSLEKAVVGNLGNTLIHDSF